MLFTVHALDYVPQEETLYNNIILDSQFEAINQSGTCVLLIACWSVLWILVCKLCRAYISFAQDQDAEIAGQIHQSFIPVNQSHQGRMQCQTSVEVSKSAIGPTSAAAGAMRRTTSQEDVLSVVTFESFKPKLKEMWSISWSPAWKTSMLATSRSVNRELS